MLGGNWAFEPDPLKAAQLMIPHIDKKGKVLTSHPGRAEADPPVKEKG
jgi:hypothetical protein